MCVAESDKTGVQMIELLPRELVSGIHECGQVRVSGMDGHKQTCL